MKTGICIKLFILSILFVQLTFTSCVPKRKIIYFQDLSHEDSLAAAKNKPADTVKYANLNYTPVFKADDYLSIEVTSIDLEAVKPFELIRVPNSQVPSYANGTAARNGYLIDANGDIDFPYLGKIHLEGMNRMQATDTIKKQLSVYIVSPVVNINIQNFKVTVLGDVRNPGTFSIPNERITLPEAIGIAGDLNITGVRNNVLVIRDVNGKKEEFRVDLTSKSVFTSPAYYLTQNDVVYVEPNRAKRNSSLVSATAGIFISVTSLIIATVNLITK